ncbi:MAG: 6,7-dimethyl-8-ribityllumazine synthase [Planctomycetota bacterium]
MARVIEGKPRGAGRRVAIVCARFNELITRELLRGCEDELGRHDVAPEDVLVAWVPGSFEIPLAAARLARRDDVDAVICLGAVIRGATDHYEHVAGEASRGIAAAGRESQKPVIFGVLTTNTIEQAIERAGTKAGNKGRDSAIAALEMIDLCAQLDGGKAASNGQVRSKKQRVES